MKERPVPMSPEPAPAPKCNPYCDPKEWLGAVLFVIGVSGIAWLLIFHWEVIVGLFCLVWPFVALLLACADIKDPATRRQTDAALGGLIIGLLLGHWFGGHHKHHD